jgi:protein-S-isoprenylcysteine O-methyltransferase Ste14
MAGTTLAAYCGSPGHDESILPRLGIMTRSLPLIGVLILFALAGGWRPWLQRRRTGSSGICMFRSGGVGQRLRDAGAVLVFTLMLVQAVAAATGWPYALSPLIARDGPGILLYGAGAVLMVAGVILLVTGQLHLGASWRIGIEAGAKPGLVTDGIYRHSRNPIFLALLMFVAGYALMLPTILSFVLLVGMYVGIRQQVAAEEAYLSETYGKAYRDYAGRVGRFVPGIGKRR